MGLGLCADLLPTVDPVAFLPHPDSNLCPLLLVTQAPCSWCLNLPLLPFPTTHSCSEGLPCPRGLSWQVAGDLPECYFLLQIHLPQVCPWSLCPLTLPPPPFTQPLPHAPKSPGSSPAHLGSRVFLHGQSPCVVSVWSACVVHMCSLCVPA